jgi:hypothetical protein
MRHCTLINYKKQPNMCSPFLNTNFLKAGAQMCCSQFFQIKNLQARKMKDYLDKSIIQKQTNNNYYCVVLIAFHSNFFPGTVIQDHLKKKERLVFDKIHTKLKFCTSIMDWRSLSLPEGAACLASDEAVFNCNRIK